MVAVVSVPELLEVGAGIARIDATAVQDEWLCELAVTLARTQSLVSAGLGRVLAELDRRGVCDRDHGLSTGGWLAREASLPAAIARSQVKVAVKLGSTLGEVDAALTEGRITWHHAKVLADACNPRVTDAVEALQGELLDLADNTLFERWRAEVRGIIELLDDDGGHDPAADLARNTLSLAETIDGITHLAGTLVGEHALGIVAAIDAKADELFRRYRADHDTCPDIEIPNRATLRALALAELCRAGGAVDLTSTQPPRPEVTLVIHADEPDEPQADQPQADQPDADEPAGASPDRPTGPRKPIRPTNPTRQSGPTGPAGPTGPPGPTGRTPSDLFGPVYTPSGARLPDRATRTLLCDSDLFALVMNSLGVPLDMGRNVRLATTAQRRAIAARDGSCVFPGCTSPINWADIHHLDPYRHGGETNLNRLAPLCRTHHGVTHRKGWQMHATQDGWFHWITPNGHTFWSQRHGCRRTGPTPATGPIAACA